MSVLGPEKVVLLIAYSDYGYEVNNCQHKNISIDGLIHHSQPLISAGPRNNIVPTLLSDRELVMSQVAFGH